MAKNNKTATVITAFILVILSACATRSSSGMQIEGAWVRAAGSGMNLAGQDQTGQGAMATQAPGHGEMMSTGTNSAAYMVIRNSTGADDRLLRVESDVAGAIELHQTLVENEVMSMRPVSGIDLPAGEQVALEPGGLHVMLIGLKQDLTVGQKVKLNLVFEKAGSLSVEAEVRAP